MLSVVGSSAASEGAEFSTVMLYGCEVDDRYGVQWAVSLTSAKLRANVESHEHRLVNQIAFIELWVGLEGESAEAYLPHLTASVIKPIHS